MREHARIAAYFAPLTAGELGAFLATDDAAVIAPPSGKKLVVTTDSVIRGVHVPATASPTQMAHKLTRRNLSDLAAMGALPWRYTLNLHTPTAAKDEWFEALAAALAEDQERFGHLLIGGDITAGKGPIAVTMTCLGLLDGQPLLRTGAKEGDTLYVSGNIGDAALGLKVLQRALKAEKAERAYLTQRYYLPEPRLALGQKLAGLASATIDCSDGLLADAARLATASDVAIIIERDAVPLSSTARALVTQTEALWDAILSGGDDYELIFTAPDSAADKLAKLSESLQLPLTRIGRVGAGEGVTLQDGQGAPLPVSIAGWEY